MSGPKERFADTPAGPMRVWEKGRGRKVFYLAGLNGLPHWPAFLDRLAETRRVIAPSLPGYPGGPDSEPLDGLMDWVIAAHDALVAAGFRKDDLIGASVGGALAAEVAALWPGEVRRLALIAPFGCYDPASPPADLFAHKPGQATAALSAKPADYARWLAPSEGADAGDWEVQTLRANIAAADLLWPLGDTGLSKRLARISAPTLVLWGAQDKVMPPHYAKLVAGGIGRRAKTKTLAKAGHMADFDDPAGAARAVAAFLVA